MEGEKDFHSSFFLPDNFNFSFNNSFFTDNLIQLPFSDFPPINCNPQLIEDSTRQHFDFVSNSPQLQTFNNSLHQLTDSPSSSSSSRKRPRFDSMVQSNRVVSPLVHPQRELARQRRQSISDKVRCLQKLMPCESKMDTATTLGEAYKYVQFLQAQVRALNAMPLDSSFVVQNNFDGCHVRSVGLGILDRQQLLQVLVNSPVAQTMLYSKGFCVFSLEQLILMNKLSHAKLFKQQIS